MRQPLNVGPGTSRGASDSKMQLTKWMETEKASGRKCNLSTVARALKVRVSTVECHAKGYKRPSIKTIAAYQKLTKGAVTFDDWAKMKIRQRPARRAAMQEAA